MKKRKSVSITVKLVSIVLASLIIGTALVGLFSYFLSRRDAVKYSGERARSIAVTVAAATDADVVTRALSTGNQDAGYKSLKALLDKTIVDNDLLYLYIVDSNYTDNFTYVAEGYPPGREEEELMLGDLESTEYVTEDFAIAISTKGPAESEVYDSGDFGRMVSAYAPVFDSARNIVAVVCVDIAVADVFDSANQFGIIVIVIVVALSVLFALFVIFFVRKTIGKPVSALAEAAGKISEGDNNIRLTKHNDDELGQLMESFNRMVESAETQTSILETLANGDLTVQVPVRSEKDSMSIAMNKMVTNLSKMFKNIHVSSETVSHSTHQIAQGAQSLAQGSIVQTQAVTQLSRRIEDVLEKTKMNAEMASDADNLSKTIKASAETGVIQMNEMMSAVQDIDTSTEAIKKVIKVIEDIAFQTNILALNAAVEAARAGQNGKGFAVVADEVRNLATKSSQSAKETNTLITDTLNKTELGVRIAQETSKSLTDIVDGISKNNEIISKIASLSEEQNDAITEINEGIDQVENVVHQNSATAQESAAASEEVSSQAEILEDLLSKFKIF